MECDPRFQCPAAMAPRGRQEPREKRTRKDHSASNAPRWRRNNRRAERQDDEVRAYSYKVIDGPLPVAKYRAELSVHQGDAEKSWVRWQSTFEAKGAPEADAIGVVQAVYQAGFDNLKKMFGS